MIWVLTKHIMYRMDENISRKQVFVVDDDKPSYQLIEELLSGKGVSLMHFTNGTDLLAEFGRGNNPDLIIMDIQLPGADGLQLTRKIKSMDNSIPIVAYTSYAMTGDRERCLESGCDEYVSKPIDLNRFVEMITRYLKD